MPEYIYLLHPYRHGFFASPTPEDEAVLEEHFRYIKQAAEDGVVLLAGSCLDDTFTLVVLRVDNNAAANAFMFGDPAVKKNIMAAELHPLRISLPGKLDTDNQ